MVAKAIQDIRDGFAPKITSPRLLSEALKHSGVAVMPTKVRPAEAKPVAVKVEKPAKAAKAVVKTPSKKAEQIAQGGTIRKGALEDALTTLAANSDLTLEGLMSEANVSRSIAARAIRENAAKAVA
jgi:hypothetical protein